MSLIDDIKDLPISAWSNPIINGSVAKTVKALAPQARSFIFDEAASRRIGEFIRDCPDILVDQMQFARLPYDVTYIEVDIHALYEAVGRRRSSQLYADPDHRIGFLSHEGNVYTLCNTRGQPQGRLTPMGATDREYAIRQPTANISHPAAMLGSTWYDLNDAQKEAFAQRFTTAYYGPTENIEEILKIMIPAAMGEVRVYLAALLFLFNRRRLTVVDRPYQRKLVKGKQRVYMAHSTVTIDIAGWLELKREFENLQKRTSPRRHEVRAHYRHRYMIPGCEHKWQRVEEAENEQWRCTCCTGLRYLCRDHLRGDAGEGFVTKTYNVTASA